MNLICKKVNLESRPYTNVFVSEYLTIFLEDLNFYCLRCTVICRSICTNDRNSPDPPVFLESFDPIVCLLKHVGNKWTIEYEINRPIPLVEMIQPPRIFL